MHEYCFYLDWSGWKPEVWAAWAQAILSAAAIYWASRLARRQDRLAQRRKADACIGLITHAQDILETATRDPLSRPNLTSIATLAKQMEGITLDATPDYRLIIAVNTAATTVAVLNGELIAWTNNIHADDTFKSVSASIDVRTAITRLEAAYEEAIPVANELMSPSPWQRIKRWILGSDPKK